jgi:Protein of unknown function (DUF4239)
MSLFWAVLVIVVVPATAVATMLLVRRSAPAGSYFADAARAAGVFGVLATAFAVLIGFVFFLAFESYDTARGGAEAEARVLTQQFETAQFLPQPAAAQLSGELVCYARSVVHQEWPAMQAGTLGDGVNPWGVAMFRTLKTVEPKSASEQVAYAKWFDQTTDRESARADRTHGAEGVIPTPLWIVLFLTAAVLFLFMLLFADSAERQLAQAAMMGGAAVVITATLLLLSFLNNPYANGPGGLRPVAMQRTLGLLAKEEAVLGTPIPVPCDASGIPSR